MVSDFLSKIFSSKIFYIVFSVVVAVSLWIFVEINENEVQTVTLSEVQVTVIGEEILHDNNLFILSLNPEYVSLTFDTSLSSAAALRSGQLSVQIDVSGIRTSGRRELPHEIIYPEGFDTRSIIRVTSSVSLVSMQIDKRTSKQIQVTAPYTGGTSSPEELIADPALLEPNEITVFGPEEVLSRIRIAHVNIERENISSTYTENLPFILLDYDGEEFDHELYSQLTFSDDMIHVTVPVLMIREMPLDVVFLSGAGASKDNISFSINPQTIWLSGDPDAFREIGNSITIGTIDLTTFGVTNAASPAVFTIIPPANLENDSGITQATVTVEIPAAAGLEIDYYSIGNIHPVNIPPGYVVDIITQSVDVRVRGRREDLDILSNLMESGGQNIRVMVDLDGLSPGQQRLFTPRVRVNIDGVEGDIGAVGEYIVSVRILE
jgi:YbbR domain-containing protein